MGYFSNGTEGMDYRAKFCERCIHNMANRRGGNTCPVWYLQGLWNSGCCRDEEKDNVLRMFIPIVDKIWNGECTMFVETTNG